MTRTKTKTKQITEAELLSVLSLAQRIEELLLEELAIQDAMCDMDNDLLYYDLNSYDFYL